MNQVLFNGFVQGLVFALVAVPFCLVFSTTRRIIFVSIGAIYAAAPYLFQEANKAGLPIAVSVILALGICSLMSFGCEQLIHWPLERRWASSEANFLASVGFFLILEQILVLVWGSELRSFNWHVGNVRSLFGINVSSSQIAILAAAISCLVLFFGCLARSQWGLACQALAANPILLSTMGVDIGQLRLRIFLIAGCLASVAGLLKANDSGFSPHTGMTTAVIGLVATTVAGQGSIFGAALVAILLGVFRELTAYYWSAAFIDTVSLAILAVSLLFFPGGIRGIIRGGMRPEEL